MLKLYKIVYWIKPDCQNLFEIFVMAYSECHAVQLLYRKASLEGKLHYYRYESVEEIDCINPAMFKKNK